MKRLNVSLTKKGSLANTIEYLQEYQKKLPSLMETFITKLVLLGVPIIDERIMSASGDKDRGHNTNVRIRAFGSYTEAVLTVEGRDIVFFEFGAGIHFNGAVGTSPRPSESGTMNGITYDITGGEELGYTIGSYGNGQGAKDYWFYVADSGEKVRSYGTEATMPMYAASMEIIKNVYTVAKEVFGYG